MNNSHRKKLPVILGLTALSALILVFLAFLLYKLNFDGGYSDASSNWGHFGDYIGGVAGTVLSFLALVALLYTIYLQNEELAKSTAELKRSAEALAIQNEQLYKQSFENTLFNYMDIHQRAIRDMESSKVVVMDSGGYEYYRREVIRKGREVIDHFIDSVYRSTRIYIFGHYKEDEGYWGDPPKEVFEKDYANLFRDNKNDFMPYLQNIINAANHIDRFPDIEKKKDYGQLFISGLSEVEKVNLYYYCSIFFSASEIRVSLVFDRIGFLSSINPHNLSLPEYIEQQAGLSAREVG